MTTIEKYKRFDAADYFESLDDVAAFREIVSKTPSSTPAPSPTRPASSPALRT